MRRLVSFIQGSKRITSEGINLEAPEMARLQGLQVFRDTSSDVKFTASTSASPGLEGADARIAAVPWGGLL